MVASAVLGAAAGTGMALIVAMTIVVYRYYTLKRKDKEWGSLDRMPFPDSVTVYKKSNKPIYAAVTQKVRKQKSYYCLSRWVRDVDFYGFSYFYHC